MERQLESRQREIRQLQPERGLSWKVNGRVENGLGIELQSLASREKTLQVDSLRALYSMAAYVGDVRLGEDCRSGPAVDDSAFFDAYRSLVSTVERGYVAGLLND